MIGKEFFLIGDMMVVSKRTRFWILILIVLISGFSQGMLLPLIAIIFEQNGISSSINGIHATSLYIGILIAAPFMERPMQKYGYRPIIVVGGILVFTALFTFPFWQSLTVWFILRILVGIGDHMLHFGTQTWITTTADPASRGKTIALYGLSFALGFSIGPLMTRLLVINETLPFMISSALSFIVWALVFLIRNEWPRQMETEVQTISSTSRFVQTFKYAWVAMLPGFGYGFLEATLNGVFPIYGLRIGHDVEMLALIIPCFAIGSIILQFPLGALSDRYGRKKVLLISLLIGTASFIAAALLEEQVFYLFLFFTIAGMFVGSLFSLGISYMTDLLPIHLLPAGNILVGIFFSIGSIAGPLLGGIYLQIFPGLSFFYLIVLVLITIASILFMQKEQKNFG